MAFRVRTLSAAIVITAIAASTSVAAAGTAEPTTASFKRAEITVRERDVDRPVVVTVKLNKRNGATPVVVQWAAVAVPGSGAAVAGDDFSAASGEVVIPARKQSATFLLNVVGDNRAESAEHFAVLLTGASGGVISNSQLIVTIEDDDSPRR